MANAQKVVLGEHELTIARARFGRFMEGEILYEKFFSAIENNNSGEAATSILDYLVLFARLPLVELRPMPWVELVSAFIKIKMLNSMPDGIPLLSLRAPQPKDNIPWDYGGRSWLVWVHLIASAYGWSTPQIYNLWPEEAAKFVQEILVDEQLEKEWEHSLSEVAYSRSKKGQTQYKPLPRPVWMRKSGGPRKTRIRKDILPQGHVEDLSGVNDSNLEFDDA